MMDFLATLIFLGFFAALIYSTVFKKSSHSCRGGSGIELMKARQKLGPPPTTPPNPVGLYCSICHDHAGVVTSEEYLRLFAAGQPVYCRWCTITIEAYKARQARR